MWNPGRSESKTGFPEMLRELLRFCLKATFRGRKEGFALWPPWVCTGHMPPDHGKKLHRFPPSGSPFDPEGVLGPLLWDPSWTVRFPFLGGRPPPIPGHGRCDPFLLTTEERLHAQKIRLHEWFEYSRPAVRAESIFMFHWTLLR